MMAGKKREPTYRPKGERPDPNEILLGLIVVMFDFKRKMTVYYKPKPAPDAEQEVIGEGKACCFFFLVFTTPETFVHPDLPYMKFTRYLTTEIHPKCADEFARALYKTAVKAADDFMQEDGGFPVDMNRPQAERADRAPKKRKAARAGK